jgi:hypothetical protein
MLYLTRTLIIPATMLVSVLAAAPVSALEPRTWVSATGSDTNPCTRPQPCASFRAAIAQAIVGGEVRVLGPGEYGPVEITNSISIVADGLEGGIQVRELGIRINAPATAVVQLRGLNIDGRGSADSKVGIQFIAGKALHIHGCVIKNIGGGPGIEFRPSAASQLIVSDTLVANNGSAAGTGISIKPTGSGSADALLNRVSAEGNENGIVADGTGNTGGIQVTVQNSAVAASANSGITALGPTGGSLVGLLIDRTTSAINVKAGILVQGSRATAWISNSTVSGNAVGIASASNGVLEIAPNNSIKGNEQNISDATISP